MVNTRFVRPPVLTKKPVALRSEDGGRSAAVGVVRATEATTIEKTAHDAGTTVQGAVETDSQVLSAEAVSERARMIRETVAAIEVADTQVAEHGASVATLLHDVAAAVDAVEVDGDTLRAVAETFSAVRRDTAAIAALAGTQANQARTIDVLRGTQADQATTATTETARALEQARAITAAAAALAGNVTAAERGSADLDAAEDALSLASADGRRVGEDAAVVAARLGEYGVQLHDLAIAAIAAAADLATQQRVLRDAQDRDAARGDARGRRRAAGETLRDEARLQRDAATAQATRVATQGSDLDSLDVAGDLTDTHASNQERAAAHRRARAATQAQLATHAAQLATHGAALVSHGAGIGAAQVDVEALPDLTGPVAEAGRHLERNAAALDSVVTATTNDAEIANNAAAVATLAAAIAATQARAGVLAEQQATTGGAMDVHARALVAVDETQRLVDARATETSGLVVAAATAHDALRTRLDTATADATALRGQLAEVVRSHEATTEETTDLATQVASRTRSIAAAPTAAETRALRTVTVTTELETHETRVTARGTAVGVLAHDVAEAQEHVAVHDAEALGTTTRGLGVLESDWVRLAADIDEVRGALTASSRAATATSTAATSVLDRKHAAAAATAETRARMGDDLASHDARLTAHATTLDRLRDATATADDAMVVARPAVETLTTAAADVSAATATATARLEAIVAAHARHQDDGAAAEATLATQAAEIAGEAAGVEARHGAIRALAAAQAATAATHASAQTDHAALATRTAATAGAIRSTEAAKDTRQAVVAIATTDVRTQATAVEESGARLGAAQGRVVATGGAVAEQSAAVDESARRLNAVRETSSAQATRTATLEAELNSFTHVSPSAPNLGLTQATPLKSIVDFGHLNATLRQRAIGQVMLLHTCDATGRRSRLPYRITETAATTGASPFLPLPEAEADASAWVLAADVHAYPEPVPRVQVRGTDGVARWVVWADVADAERAAAAPRRPRYQEAHVVFRSADDACAWYAAQAVAVGRSCDGVYRVDPRIVAPTTVRSRGVDVTGYWVVAEATTTATAPYDAYCVFRDGSGWELALVDAESPESPFFPSGAAESWDSPGSGAMRSLDSAVATGTWDSGTYAPLHRQTHVTAVLVESGDQADWVTFPFDNDEARECRRARDRAYRYYTSDAVSLATLLSGDGAGRAVDPGADDPGVVEAYVDVVGTAYALDGDGRSEVNGHATTRSLCARHASSSPSALAGWNYFSIAHGRPPTTLTEAAAKADETYDRGSFGATSSVSAATDTYALARGTAAESPGPARFKANAVGTVRIYVRRRGDGTVGRRADAVDVPHIHEAVETQTYVHAGPHARGVSFARPVVTIVDLGEVPADTDARRYETLPTYLWACDVHGDRRPVPCHVRDSPVPGDTPFNALTEAVATGRGTDAHVWVAVDDVQRYARDCPWMCVLDDVTAARQCCVWLRPSDVAGDEDPARRPALVHRLAHACFRSANDAAMWYRLQGVVPGPAQDGVYRIDASLTTKTWDMPRGATRAVRGYWATAAARALSSHECPCVFRNDSGWELALVDADAAGSVPVLSYGSTVGWDDPKNATATAPATATDETSRTYASFVSQTHVDAVLVEEPRRREWVTFVFDNDACDHADFNRDSDYQRLSTEDAGLLDMLRSDAALGRCYRLNDRQSLPSRYYRCVGGGTETYLTVTARRMCARHAAWTPSGLFDDWRYFSLRHGIPDATGRGWFSFGRTMAMGDGDAYVLAASTGAAPPGPRRYKRTSETLCVYVRRGLTHAEYDGFVPPRPLHGAHVDAVASPASGPGRSRARPVVHSPDAVAALAGLTLSGREEVQAVRYLWTRCCAGWVRAVPYRSGGAAGSTPFTAYATAVAAVRGAVDAQVWVHVTEPRRYGTTAPAVQLRDAAGCPRWRAWVPVAALPTAASPSPPPVAVRDVRAAAADGVVGPVRFRSANDLRMWYRLQGVEPDASYDGIYLVDDTITTTTALTPRDPVDQEHHKSLTGYWAVTADSDADALTHSTACVFRDRSGWELGLVDGGPAGDQDLFTRGTSRSWDDQYNASTMAPVRSGFAGRGVSGHDAVNQTTIYAPFQNRRNVDAVLVEDASRDHWVSFVFDNDEAGADARHTDAGWMRYTTSADDSLSRCLRRDGVGHVSLGSGDPLPLASYRRLRQDGVTPSFGVNDLASQGRLMCTWRSRSDAGDFDGSILRDWTRFSLKHTSTETPPRRLWFSFGDDDGATRYAISQTTDLALETPDGPRYKHADTVLRFYLRRTVSGDEYALLNTQGRRRVAGLGPTLATTLSRGMRPTWPVRTLDDLRAMTTGATPTRDYWIQDALGAAVLCPVLSGFLTIPGSSPFTAMSPASVSAGTERRWMTVPDHAMGAYAHRSDVPRVLLRLGGGVHDLRWRAWVSPEAAVTTGVPRRPLRWQPRSRDGQDVHFRSAQDVFMWYRMRGVEPTTALDGIYLLSTDIAATSPISPEGGGHPSPTPLVGYWRIAAAAAATTTTTTATTPAPATPTYCAFRGGSGWERMLVDAGAAAAPHLPYGEDTGWHHATNSGPYLDEDPPASPASRSRAYAPFSTQTAVDAVLVEDADSHDWASFVFDNDGSGAEAHRYSTGSASLRQVLLDPSAASAQGIVRRGDGTDAAAETYAHRDIGDGARVVGATVISAVAEARGRSFCARHDARGTAFRDWTCFSLRHRSGTGGETCAWFSFGGEAADSGTYMLAHGGAGTIVPGTARYRSTPTGELRFYLRRERRLDEYAWFTGLGGFTGVHRNPTTRAPEDLRPGMLVESTGVMSSDVTISHAYTYVDLTSQARSKRVYGVVETVAADGGITVNSLGEGGIWVCDAGGPVRNGDYVTSSAIPGFGMRQDSADCTNYTAAKATTDCDFYGPGSAWLDTSDATAVRLVQGVRGQRPNDSTAPRPDQLAAMARQLRGWSDDHDRVAAAGDDPGAREAAYDAVVHDVAEAERRLAEAAHDDALSTEDALSMAKVWRMRRVTHVTAVAAIRARAMKVPVRAGFVACTYHCG